MLQGICLIFIILGDSFVFFSVLKFYVPYFCISHFAPITREIETLQHIVVLSHYHGNNQDTIQELSVV